MKKDPYTQGWEARSSGLGCDECPYMNYTRECELWHEGYFDAGEAYIE